MLASFKSIFKWNIIKSNESNNESPSLILLICVHFFEDVLFWKKIWLSLLCFFLFNILFFSCVYRQLNLLQFIFGFAIFTISLDAFETWLKFKHRTTCLKRLASHEDDKLVPLISKIIKLVQSKFAEFIYLRDKNHTKAFVILQLILSIVFIIGRYSSGYTIIYLLSTLVFFARKILPPIVRVYKKIQHCAESDFELEGLVPEESDANLDLLSIEPDRKLLMDEKQSLDYWKPEDLPIEEGSDSDNSSSVITNLSIEKMQTLVKDVENTDSSEDEYIPQEHQSEHYQSSLEVQPIDTWSSAAYNALSNLGGAVSNLVYSSQDTNRRKRVSSFDSSDGFEMIDKNDL
ncbi:unnamed protein product [Danaus chrysippus]|uniref:(African queen) hypothetical protein n=1 Tax=Danaus chrysippus TaxID=151541 RepID=A0A8J2R5Y3_9NEOP|nr:unnamed protein product [Danaus chrysippus]